MKLTPWSEIEKRYFTPKEIKAARAAARRSILVEFAQWNARGPWIAFVRGPRGTNVYAHGEKIPVARRRARAELVAAVGKTRAAELWRGRAETMPAGAEEDEGLRQLPTRARRK
jgi:hypothetical protein